MLTGDNGIVGACPRQKFKLHLALSTLHFALNIAPQT